MKYDQMKRIMYTCIVLLLLPPCIFLSGHGGVLVLSAIGFTNVSEDSFLLVGVSVVTLLFLIPQSFIYLNAHRKFKKYFPISNENIRNYKQVYSKYIDEEIHYLRNAVDEAKHRGMMQEHEHFSTNLSKFMELRSLIMNDNDLQREELIYLNHVFNKGFMLMKLQQ